jgi:hypothetical protein
MGSRLINNLTFTNIAAATQSAQAHGLNITGIGIVPDLVQFDNSAFDMISCTATTITVINRGGATASCSVRVSYDHSIQRAFGNTAIDALTPTPFVDRGSSGSTGFQAIAGKMTKSVIQAIPNLGAATVLFEAVTYDTAGSMVDLANDRFVIPVTGVYLVTGIIEWEAIVIAGGFMALNVIVNGAAVPTAVQAVDGESNGVGPCSNIVATGLSLSAGAAVQFGVTQTTGAPRDITQGEGTIQRVS